MHLTIAQLTDEVRSRVAALGYELVDLRSRGSGRRTYLQIRIDRPDTAPGHGVTVAECARVSRALEQWLDAAEVIGLRYRLEVSSPGIERPIRWPEHWRRFTGSEVRVKLPDRGRIKATIVRVPESASVVVLRPADTDEEITVPLDDAQDATLVVDWSEIERSTSQRARR